MNTKTTLTFSIMGTVALVLLIAFAPIVGGHQAFAFGWHGSPWDGYYGGWPGHYGGWGWHHGWGW